MLHWSTKDLAESGAARLRLVQPNALTAGDEAAWTALGEAAEAPSVFAEPWLMRCSLRHCDAEGEAWLAIVEGMHGDWLGMLPVMPVFRQGRVPLPAWQAWRHPNQFVGSPLVRRYSAQRFWRELLDGLADEATGLIALMISELPFGDPVTAALLEVCAEDGRVLTIDRRAARACLSAATPPQPSAKQASRLRGLERKLTSEVGPVEFSVARDAGQLEAFLELERSGWKGRAGSALSCSEQTRAFFTDVARQAAARGQLEVASLRAGGRLLAVSTQLESKGRAYGFKAAYDEDYARYAPGLLLLDRLTRSYLERGGPELDSCAAPDQQPVSRLWPGRREMIDCRVALGGVLRTQAFAAMIACERAARELVAG